MSVPARPVAERSKPPRRRRGQGSEQARGNDGPPRQSDGGLVADFIEAFVPVTKGDEAGQQVRLRPWQRDVLTDLFEIGPDGRRRYRIGLLGLPRKNGKSLLGSGIALDGLFDEPGAEVYSCAGEKDQARIVFGEARKAVELDPELAAKIKVYRDALELTETGSVYRVLSAEAYSKEGLNPSRVLFDEVHVQPDEELWNVMRLGMGARRNPLLLGITTAGVKTDASGRDSLCYRLYQYGQRVLSGEVDDPTFFFRWWEAPAGSDWRDPAIWASANPAYGDWLYPDSFSSDLTTPEPEFRTKRLNQWVNSTQAALPFGLFEGRKSDRRLRPDEPVVLFFDGSFNHDCTALVACSLDGHLEVVECWERPPNDDAWRVPIADVDQAITVAFRDLRIVELAADPFRWAKEIEGWVGKGWPVIEYPTSAPSRMVPAWAKFYDALVNGRITHDGDPRLVRHVGNMVLKIDRLGPRPVKEHRGSGRSIDLAICAVGAYDRATWHASQPVETVGAPRFIPFDD